MNSSRVIGVLTSGGDGPGMNAAVRAVARTAIFNGCSVLGIHQGYEGLIENDFVPLDLRSVGGIINRGGTIIQTARSERFRTPDGRRKAYENLSKADISGLIVIGGDGSFHGLNTLIEEFGIQGIGIPGTIDNDLYGTEYTIGFDTALNTAMESIDKLRDTATSHGRLFIVEVMGRHAGYIALLTGIASGAEEIFIPETEDDYVQISERLISGKKRGKRSHIVVVAEGDESGGAFAVKEKLEKYLIDWPIRVSILGHIQRGGSPSLIDRVVASRLGSEAVNAILENKSGIMIGYKGLNEAVTEIPLKETWEKRKPIDMSWLKLAEELSI